MADTGCNLSGLTSCIDVVEIILQTINSCCSAWLELSVIALSLEERGNGRNG